MSTGSSDTRAEGAFNQRKRVVVIEDSALLRERLIQAINSMDCCEVVGSAETERDAIAQVAALRPDLVVADIQLRNGSGLSVLREIRASPRPQPTVVMFTNYGSGEYYRQSLAAGADAVFDKTTQYPEFLEFLGRTLQ